jgi:hypothetical protein
MHNIVADIGHFGRLPIQLGWFAIVSPAPMLNYSAREDCFWRPSRSPGSVPRQGFSPSYS